jgi:hypothetical protein
MREQYEASAAGQANWGQEASADQIRYLVPMASRYRNRRRCHCGCEGKQTSVGAANGLGLMGGCEWSVRRWVRYGFDGN